VVRPSRDKNAVPPPVELVNPADQGQPHPLEGRGRLVSLASDSGPLLAVVQELLEPSQERRAAPAFGKLPADRVGLLVGQSAPRLG
jgi:hypothetical protein